LVSGVKINVDQPPSTEAVITSLLLVHTHTVFALVAAQEFILDDALEPVALTKNELLQLLFKLERTRTPLITNKIVNCPF